MENLGVDGWPLIGHQYPDPDEIQDQINRRAVDSNDPWMLWTPDAIYTQSQYEYRRLGFDQNWPIWAQNMITHRHDAEVVDLSGERAFQGSILLANENCREVRRLLTIERVRNRRLQARFNEMEGNFNNLLRGLLPWIELLGERFGPLPGAAVMEGIPDRAEEVPVAGPSTGPVRTQRARRGRRGGPMGGRGGRGGRPRWPSTDGSEDSREDPIRILEPEEGEDEDLVRLRMGLPPAREDSPIPRARSPAPIPIPPPVRRPRFGRLERVESSPEL